MAEHGAEGEALIVLADEHAALGHWAPAAALYAEARRRGPLPLPAWVRGALVELELGDRAAYGSLCRAMLERHSEVETPEEADFIARTCALGPEATVDLKAAVDLAEFAVGRCATRPTRLPLHPGGDPLQGGTGPGWAGAAGRVGRGETGPQGDPGPAVPGDGPASARPGRRIGANLRRGEAANRRPGAEDHPFSWPDRVEYEVLRREAEALILGPRRNGANRPGEVERSSWRSWSPATASSRRDRGISASRVIIPVRPGVAVVAGDRLRRLVRPFNSSACRRPSVAWMHSTGRSWRCATSNG